LATSKIILKFEKYKIAIRERILKFKRKKAHAIVPLRELEIWGGGVKSRKNQESKKNDREGRTLKKCRLMPPL
jgi:hypothetical protein